MEITKNQAVNTLVERTCDVCENSLNVDVEGENVEEYGELRAKWGSGSKQDGKLYRIALCENCFMTAYYALRDKRKTEFMFKDQRDFTDESFGVNDNSSPKG